MSHPSESASQTILNVDDVDAMRYARSRTLMEAGYRVIEASAGEEALLMVAALRPQLVVLDVNLPGINGLDVCRRIKSDPDNEHIMILQVSADRNQKLDVLAGLDGGADGYLIEPIDPLELVATVRALLRLSERQTENRYLAERLTRVERQFAEATDAADCGVWDWDIRSGRLEWFGKTERLAGLRPGSFSGKIEGFSDILHADDRTRVWQKLQDLMDRRETHFEDEHRYVHPDGSVHWMSGVGRFFYDEQGQAVRMTGVVQDITTRKLAEQRQQLESERRRLLACAAEQLLGTEHPHLLMRGVFETVRQHLDLDGYFHYRVDESGSALVLEACAGVSDETFQLFQHLDFGQALCGTAAQGLQPVIRERLHEVHDEKAQAVKALGVHAYACHPLTVGERLLGTLSFTSKIRDRFDPDEIGFMRSICRYVAAATDRLRLETETKERAERLRRSEEHLRCWKDELEVRVEERTRELVASQERLRALAAQLSLTEQRERRRLASDLHDYLAQLLVIGRMKMNQVKKQPALSPATQALTKDLDDIFQQALHYTRTMIAELSPPSLQGAGLPAALKWLADRMQKDGLWVEVQSNREHVPLPEEKAMMLFQSVRELLFNVLKHAGVDRALVRLTVEEDGAVRVAVEDQGKGLGPDALQPAGEPGHLGLFSVRERVDAMGGRMEVALSSGQGTTVTLILPVLPGRAQ